MKYRTMLKDKSNIEAEKNKLSNSSISAGEKVHIGDIYNIQNHDSGNKKGDNNPKKGSMIFKYISMALLSVTLVGISINRLVIVENNFSSEEDPLLKKGTAQEEIIKPIAIEPLKPKPIPIYINALEIQATPEKYKGMFTSKMEEMLRSSKIKYQQNKNGNVANHIKCTFELQETKAKSGIREVIKYSLTLQVEIIGNAGQTCFSGFYSSGKPRIGYPEDGEDVIRSKVIEPCLAEVKTSFQQNLPTLCEVQ